MNSIQVRRGAASLAELAESIRQDLATGQPEQDTLRLVWGFADDFRGSNPAGQASLIAEEPAPTGVLQYDAMLAGVAEFFATEAGLPVPAWVNGPGRFAEPWWFVTENPWMHAYVLTRAPATFARHGVFVSREALHGA